jgi:hypothetical protein
MLVSLGQQWRLSAAMIFPVARARFRCTDGHQSQPPNTLLVRILSEFLGSDGHISFGIFGISSSTADETRTAPDPETAAESTGRKHILSHKQ